MRRDAKNPNWRKGALSCWLMQGDIALKSGAKEQALQLAQRSATAAGQLHSGDSVSDGFAAAKAYLLLGDAQRDLGDLNAARASWSQALAVIPARVPLRPDEIASHARVLSRLGRQAEASSLQARLRSMGYRTLGLNSVSEERPK